jgi:hypothetical protein
MQSTAKECTTLLLAADRNVMTMIIVADIKVMTMILVSYTNVMTMILVSYTNVMTMILEADGNVLTVILAADVHFAVNSNLVIEITAANSNSMQHNVNSIYRTDCRLPFHSKGL